MYEPWVNDLQAFSSYITSTLGDRPQGMTLDRIDNDQGYQPGNLRWATKLEQVRNRRPQTTNTGEPRISYNKRHKQFIVTGTFPVLWARTLSEAISLRNGALDA